MKNQYKLYYLRKTPISSMFTLYLLIVGLIFLPTSFLGEMVAENATLQGMISLAVSRAVYFVVMLWMLVQLGFGRVLTFRGCKPVIAILISLPAFVVALDNLPFLQLLTGAVKVDARTSYLIWFAVQCLFVGAFEETAFRGIVFPLILQSSGTDKKGRLVGVLGGAAVFGLLHIVNLFGGGNIGGVMMQIGYSFLIGSMLCVLTFRGVPLWISIAVHALFNFCGTLIDTLGYGTQWDTPRIVLTVIIGVIMAVYFAYLLMTSDSDAADKLSKADFTESPDYLRH